MMTSIHSNNTRAFWTMSRVCQNYNTKLRVEAPVRQITGCQYITDCLKYLSITIHKYKLDMELGTKMLNAQLIAKRYPI